MSSSSPHVTCRSSFAGLVRVVGDHLEPVLSAAASTCLFDIFLPGSGQLLATTPSRIQPIPRPSDSGLAAAIEGPRDHQRPAAGLKSPTTVASGNSGS